VYLCRFHVMKHTDTYLKNVPLYVESEGVSVEDMEEAQYFWALSDMSSFVVKYGLERVLRDLEDYIVCRDQNGF
jgi:hypothetical protein